MDYKTLGGGSHMEYEAFGNFNYGAVTAALGMSSYLSQNGAGVYQQWRGDASVGSGIPFLQSPYGDQNRDADQIALGREYAKCGCK